MGGGEKGGGGQGQWWLLLNLYIKLKQLKVKQGLYTSSGTEFLTFSKTTVFSRTLVCHLLLNNIHPS